MDRRKGKVLFFDFFLTVALVIVDQLTKYMAVERLKDQPAISLIDGVLSLQYLENKGAAFGLLQDQKYFFVVVAVIFLSVIACVLAKVPTDRKYDRLNILLAVIAAGALGNLIDRLRLDYVVDFIYIVLIDFPIFNVADMYVTFSAAILVIQVLFVYQDEDFAFLSLRRKNSESGSNHFHGNNFHGNSLKEEREEDL